MRIKCLSVQQPFAAGLVTGAKKIEVRTWRTDYRGTLVIQASGRPVKLDDGEILPTGVAIGTVELVDCRPMTKNDCRAAIMSKRDWQPGLWAWVVKNPVEFEHPWPLKGKLHIFEADLPDDLF